MGQLNTAEREFVQIMAKITVESINRLQRATGWVDNYQDLVACQKSLIGDIEYENLENKTPDNIEEYQAALQNRKEIYCNMIEDPETILQDLPGEE